jgi:hypothetical protein
MPLTSEFFEALGRLTFEFTALEQMVGLCILQLDPSQDHEAIWRDSFDGKLRRLRRDLARKISQVTLTPDWTLLDAAINDATKTGHKRNTIVHGVLHFDPNGEVLLKNLARDTTHAVDPSVIEEVTGEVSALYDQFVGVRSSCAGLLWATSD